MSEAKLRRCVEESAGRLLRSLHKVYVAGVITDLRRDYAAEYGATVPADDDTLTALIEEYFKETEQPIPSRPDLRVQRAYELEDEHGNRYWKLRRKMIHADKGNAQRVLEQQADEAKRDLALFKARRRAWESWPVGIN